jgi:hypothetical protein
MTYRVAYSDDPGSEELLEAQTHKDAAAIFFFKHPKMVICDLVVTLVTPDSAPEIRRFHIDEFLDDNARFRLRRTAPLSQLPAKPTSAITRYQDAYLVAKVTVRIADVIKTVGMVFGIAVCVGGFLLASQFSGIAGLMLASIVLAVAFGGFGGILLYLLGVLIAAQGQTLLASLDEAVHTSPFLTNDQRADVMSITE